MTDATILILSITGLCLCGTLSDGIAYLWHGIQKRKPREIVFPPQTTIGVHIGDDIPY